MTEAEWLAGTDSVAMLRHLNRPRGDRRLQLYLVACCRERWNLLVEADSREGVEWAERFADGLTMRDEEYERLEWASEGAFFKYDHQRSRISRHDPQNETLNELADTAYLANLAMFIDTTEPYHSNFHRERTLLSAALLLDMFGNPFRSIVFNPDCRTSTVAALARGMYESHDFSPMPLLADALQDAGCENEDILNHCRSSGPHVRGCWVVDLVLGKSY